MIPIRNPAYRFFCHKEFPNRPKKFVKLGLAIWSDKQVTVIIKQQARKG